MKMGRRAVCGAVAAAALLGLSGEAEAELTAKHGFNDQEIAWKLYDEGLAEAKRTGKPMFVLFHTTWCPHCQRYKPMFFDAAVVEELKRYVCVIVDRDEQPGVNDRYSDAGGFVPRTMVLEADGAPRYDIEGANDAYPHFIDYRDRKALRRFLARARGALAG